MSANSKIGTWSYNNPVNIVSGTGYQNTLKMLKLNGTVLLVTSQSFKKRGIVDVIKSIFLSAKVLCYDQVCANPTAEKIKNIAKEFKDETVDYIIALGGGSVIDTAKVLSVIINEKDEDFLEKLLKNNAILDDRQAVKLIAIPTTAGTGSEATPFATVWDFAEKKKQSIDHSKLYPWRAILDESLTLSLSYNQTLFTGLDAISHAMESLWNINANPISRMYSCEALKIAIRVFRELLENLEIIKLRKEMQLASFLSGMAISQTRTAIAHSISYPLTYNYNVPHGLASSFTLEAISRKVQEYKVLNADEQIILDESVVLLQQLPIKKMIREYLSLTKAMGLLNEMYHPARMKNFILKLSVLELKQILVSSYNDKNENV